MDELSPLSNKHTCLEFGAVGGGAIAEVAYSLQTHLSLRLTITILAFFIVSLMEVGR